jgi:hypothetical protein
MNMEKYLILLAIASFCKECVGSFVYFSRQYDGNIVVELGALMDIIMTIGLPVLVALSIFLLNAVWWMPAVAVTVGWLSAKIIGVIPFVNIIMWMVSYIGLPVSVVWEIIEMINLYN